MSLRLQNAFGIPRAVVPNAAAASVLLLRTGDFKVEVSPVASSRLSQNNAAALFPRALARRRRPVFHRRTSPPCLSRWTRMVGNLWENSNVQGGSGRRWTTSTARGSGEDLPSTAEAEDGDFGSFVRDECEDAARGFGGGRDAQKGMGRSVERSVKHLETVAEAFGRSSSSEREADGVAHVVESLHRGGPDGRELHCLTHVVESPGREFLSVLQLQEDRIRGRVRSSGSVEHSGFGSKLDRRVERRGASSKRYGMSGEGGSSIGTGTESREMMQEREVSGSAGGGLAEVKPRLHEHSNAGANFEDEDKRFMAVALVEARKAAMAGEVPVGCVVVQNRRIIARAYNSVESRGDPTAHAEMLCIQSACKKQGNWRLMDATLYVTLEPCPMCAGAILQARVGELVWGSRNTLLGADGSWVSLFPEGEGEMMGDREGEISPTKEHPFHRSLTVRRGVLASDCAAIMKSFFQDRRKNRAIKTKPLWLPLAIWVLFTRIHRRWSGLRGFNDPACRCQP